MGKNEHFILFLHPVHHEDLVLLHSNPFDLLLQMPDLISRHWRLCSKLLLASWHTAPSFTLSDTHLSGQLAKCSKLRTLWHSNPHLVARMNFLPTASGHSSIYDLEFFKKYLFIYLVVLVLVAAHMRS